MVSELKEWVIHEPWDFGTDNDEDVGNYLWNRGFKVLVSSRSGYAIYHVKISTEDLVVLKILFPTIIIKDNTSK